MTPAVDLAAIRERANNATPGPWEFVDDYIGIRQTPLERHRVGPNEYEIEGIVPGEYVRENDAVFIAHAREDIPALLEHVDTLTARIAAVRELHREGRNSCCAGGTICDHCEMRWPCPTIRKLG